MKTEVQTPAAATNFNGTANLGLVPFAGIALPADDITTTVIVIGVALENNGAQLFTAIDCFLFPPSLGLATTVKYTIARFNATENQIERGFSKMGCHIPVPRMIRGTPGLELWNLALVTTKDVDQVASLIVSYELGKVLPNG